MPATIDLDSIVLVVANTVDDERYGVGYVMEPVPNLHDHFPVLIDSNGREHHPYVSSQRYISHDETKAPLVEYTFWFGKEHEPNFPVGEQLTRPPAPWREEIPKADLIAIDYRASIVNFDHKSTELKTSHECRFTIDSCGNTTVSIESSIYREPDMLVDTNVGEKAAKKLLERFQRCFSERDCYSTILVDDTARSMKLRFSDGSEINLEGTFGYGDPVAVFLGEFKDAGHDDTAWTISDFVINSLRVSGEDVHF